jgi:hypothetical protein
VTVVPRPPPTCPTIIKDVGILFGVVLPVGVNERLLARLMVRFEPVGTVIITGDQPVAEGFALAHVAPPADPLQVYPHMGTVVPSGRVVDDGPAVRFTDWAAARPVPTRRTAAPRSAVFMIALREFNRISVLLA